MATLTINFTPVPGIASYNVCYKPVGAPAFICIEDSASPVVVNNIDCGVDYEISVTTNCPPGEFLSTESIPATAVVEGIPCPPPVSCISYTASTSSAGGTTTTFRGCDNSEQQITIGGVNGFDATTFCAIEGTVNAGGETTITINGPCEEGGHSITVTSVNGSMEPCIGGTIDDYMSAAISLDAPVTVETHFNVDVYWSEIGTGCGATNTQSFTITVASGESQGQIIACSGGAYFASGANICGAAVTGHDNTVDAITF